MQFRTQARRAATVGSLSALVLAVACDAPPEPRQALRAYFEAVQNREIDALFCLSAGAARAEELGPDETSRRESFERWADAEYSAYLLGRDEGWVEPGNDGIRWVKLLALGKGAFIREIAIRRPGPEAVILRGEVRTGYSHLDLSGLSPGTTFYLCGKPAGRVHAIRVPVGSARIGVEVLDSIQLDWTLVRHPASERCEAGWGVVGVEPVDGTLQSTDVVWVF